MAQITTFTSIGGIPFRAYGLTSLQTTEAAEQSSHFVPLPLELPARGRMWGRAAWEERQQIIVERFTEYGMCFIYAQSGNIKADVRNWIAERARTDSFHGPWTYSYDDGADVVAFSSVEDAIIFRMSVEHYDFMSSIPEDFANQISRESR